MRRLDWMQRDRVLWGVTLAQGGPHPGPHLLPQTLTTLRQVEVINFGDCMVRSKGAVAIADAIRGGLPKLKVLADPLPPPCRVPAPPRSG